MAEPAATYAGDGERPSPDPSAAQGSVAGRGAIGDRSVALATPVGVAAMDRLGALPVVPATGGELFWDAMWARAYPRIVGALRERSWLVFETVLPLLGVAAYVFVYRSLSATPEFIGFAVLGGAMTAFWLNVLWSMASQLYWDKDQGNLELYVGSPSPMMAILLGMAVGGMLMASVRAVIILGLGSLLFGVSYEVGSLPQLVTVFAVTLAALYGMGMVFASVFLVAGREAWHLSSLLQEPIYLASGLYFPVRALGFWVATIASIVPLTLGLDAMRQLLFAGSATMAFLSVRAEIGILGVLTVFFLALAYVALSRLEEAGRRHGRLIEKRR